MFFKQNQVITPAYCKHFVWEKYTTSLIISEMYHFAQKIASLVKKKDFFFFSLHTSGFATESP